MVEGQSHLEAVTELLVEDWVPDPVLMPTGRPNIVEGIGAIYHLVRGDDDEIALYVIKASPELNLKYARKKMAMGEPEPASEFSGVVGTLSLGHGVAPPEPVGEWSILKIYEKSVIWIRHGPEEASL